MSLLHLILGSRTPVKGVLKRFGLPNWIATTDVNNLLHLFPFSLPYGGNVNRTTGAFGSRGSGGNFGSSGAYSGVIARGLDFYGASVWPENHYYKTYGFSVRCLVNYKAWETDICFLWSKL